MRPLLLSANCAWRRMERLILVSWRGNGRSATWLESSLAEIVSGKPPPRGDAADHLRYGMDAEGCTQAQQETWEETSKEAPGVPAKRGLSSLLPGKAASFTCPQSCIPIPECTPEDKTKKPEDEGKRKKKKKGEKKKKKK